MPYSFKQFREDVTSEKVAGPLPTFSVFHLLLALEIIAEKPIGRNKLAENLRVGEGVVRTILSKLKDADLITTSKTGCRLTKKGLSLWREYKSILRKTEIGQSELTDANYNSAVLVKNQGFRLKSGMDQRDAAVVAGAKNATTMVFKGGRLAIPSVSDNVAEDFPEAANQIINALNPKDDDVIIIVGADSLEKAEHGALAAAWTLIDNH